MTDQKKILAFWRGRTKAAAQCCADWRATPVELGNPVADYAELACSALDGTTLRARYLCPKGADRVPTVLMFHDWDRGVRGWHHMTRFLALGYAVLALENRTGFLDVTAGFEGAPDDLAAARLFEDAITLGQLAVQLPHTDPDRLIAWGEGFGGGLAIVAAAMTPCGTCAALHPLPTGYRRVWEESSKEGFYAGLWAYFRNRDPQHLHAQQLFDALDYIDCAVFAAALEGKLLMGTGMMDPISPPDTQLALFAAAGGDKRHICYPKHAHERINAFENELLKFLHD
jgi:cephalosporin-C deacetylase-like acetyl esterase